MTPKAVPVAPLGLWARQCHADADVEAAAAIIAPTNIATRKRLTIALPDVYARNSIDYHSSKSREYESPKFSPATLAVSEGARPCTTKR